MAMTDLYTALNMFKQGVQQYQTSRALNDANQQVQQIRSSDMADAQKRVALTNLSQDLVSRMGAIGAPVDQIQEQSKAFLPPQFQSADAMYNYGATTGNKDLMNEAQGSQTFGEKPALDKERMQLAIMAPYRQAMLNEKTQNTDFKYLTGFTNDLDQAKASSRTAFGQWAQVNNNGSRIQALLSNPKHWSSLTGPEIALVGEALTKQMTGGVPTTEEQKELLPFSAQIAAAKAKYGMTTNPVPLDLTKLAGLMNNITQREDVNAKSKTLDNLLYKIKANSFLAKRPGTAEGYKQATAHSLAQAGINVDPSGIDVDPKGNVTIPELQPILNAASKVPQLVRKAKSGDPEAQAVIKQYGLDPGMTSSELNDRISAMIKQKAFQ